MMHYRPILRTKFFAPLLSFGLSMATMSIASANPTILNYSPSGAPGDVIFLQGDSFGTTPTVKLTGGGATNLALSIVSSWKPAATGPAYLTVALPNNLSTGLYTLTLSDGTNTTTAAINKAIGTDLEMPDVLSGQSIRVFGRNLVMPGQTSTARFYDPTTSTSLTATVNAAASNVFALKLTAPAGLVANKVYTVYVNNGYGETAVAQTVTAKSGTDHWGLGVGWGGDFSFSYVDTISAPTGGDDHDTIQAAINDVSSHGGGVVHLNAGTYTLTGNSGISMKPGVVLEGAGSASTIIQYGFVAASSIGIYLGQNLSKIGLANLTVQDVDTVGNWTDSIRVSLGGTEIFFKNCVFNVGLSRNVGLQSVTRCAMEGCTVTQGLGPSYSGCLYWSGDYGTFQGNTFSWSWGAGVQISGGSHVLVENNTLTRDCYWEHNGNPLPSPLPLCRSMSANYHNDDQFLNNTFNVTHGPQISNNDAETFLNEGGGPNPLGATLGTVSSATSTTLVDTSQSFSGLTSNAVVMITNGVGMGQWRSITAFSGTTLTISTPWTIQPTAGCRYAVRNWSGSNTLFMGNTMTNGPRGLWFYCAPLYNLVVYGNTLKNNEGILFRSDQRSDFSLQWDVLVANNTVTETNSQTPASINTFYAQNNLDPYTWGAGSMGIELRNNIVTGTGSAVTFPIGSRPEGMENDLVFGYNYNTNDEGIPAVLGTIMQNNVITNCTTGLTLDTGSYATVLRGNVLAFNTTNLSDYFLSAASHASVGTANLAPQVIQGESGTYAGGASTVASANAVGGNLAGNFNSTGASNQISGVNGGATGGNYQLTLRYAWPATTTMSVYANGTLIQDVSFPGTGGYFTFASKSITIPLVAGTGNTIMIKRNSTDTGVNIDQYAIGN